MRTLIGFVLVFVVSAYARQLQQNSKSAFLEQFFNSPTPNSLDLSRFDDFEFFDESTIENEEYFNEEETSSIEESEIESDTPYESTYVDSSPAYVDPFTQKRYHNERRKLIYSDAALEFGTQVELSHTEEACNNVYNFHKRQEFRDAFNDPKQFGAALHLNRGKQFIERSKVYSILKKMQKGCNLNLYLVASIRARRIVEIIRNDPDLLMCFNQRNGRKVLYFTRIEGSVEGCSKYYKISETRAAANDTGIFDKKLESYFSLYSSRPEYTNWGFVDASRRKALTAYETLTSLFRIKKYFILLVPESIRQQLSEHVICMEYRYDIRSLVNDDGSETTSFETARLFERLVMKAKSDYSDLVSVKMITLADLNATPEEMDSCVSFSNRMNEYNPDIFIGMDVVGYEDYSKQWKSHYKSLQKINYGRNRLFCTVGNTNHIGSRGDRNCYDGFQMECTRIAGAYSCAKHKSLFEKMIQRKRVIEATPITDQSLNYCQDLRNHPVVFLLQNNADVVLGTCMPGINGGSMAFEHYYLAFAYSYIKTGFLHHHQMVLNSIEKAILTDAEREEALIRVKSEHLKFCRALVKGNY